MKNLKKLSREHLRVITGSIQPDQCQRDLDCGPTGCALCVDLKGRNVCLYINNPVTCPEIAPL
jgi:hypothetical protein